MKNIDKGVELLIHNHAGAFRLVDGTIVNYGVIRLVYDRLIYYTGKGLREMWSPNLTESEKKIAEELKHKSEDQLISSGHIAQITLDQIDRVLF